MLKDANLLYILTIAAVCIKREIEISYSMPFWKRTNIVSVVQKFNYNYVFFPSLTVLTTVLFIKRCLAIQPFWHTKIQLRQLQDSKLQLVVWVLWMIHVNNSGSCCFLALCEWVFDWSLFSRLFLFNNKLNYEKKKKTYSFSQLICWQVIFKSRCSLKAKVRTHLALLQCVLSLPLWYLALRCTSFHSPVLW